MNATSPTTLGNLNAQGLYLRPELDQLSDYSIESIRRMRARNRKHPLRVRIATNVAKRLKRATAAIDRVADVLSLRLGALNVTHENSPSIEGRDVPASATSEPILGDASDAQPSSAPEATQNTEVAR